MADDFRRFGGGGSTLKLTVDATSTSIYIEPSASFPSNSPFDIVIDSEIITVLSVSYSNLYQATLLTVSRGQESTTSSKHLKGRPATPVLTKKSFLGVTDDKSFVSVCPVADTSIVIKTVEGNGIFLIDPMTNDWRRFQAREDILPPLLNDGECADIFAYWNDLAQETRYFMVIWSGGVLRPATALNNGVAVRSDSLSATPRRYIGTVQKQGSLYTPTAYRVNLATTNNLTARHEGFKVVRLNPTVSGAVLHGLQSARDGKAITLGNISSSQAVLLKHSSLSALTNEKLILPSGGDLTIPPGGGVVCVYDVVTRAWRIVNNCFIRPPRNNDPELVMDALEDGLGNLLVYSDESDSLILYQGN